MMFDDVLMLVSKNGLLGNYFSKNGIKVENVWKNDHFSKRKYFILKLFNKERFLYEFDKNLIKNYNKIIISQTNGISSIVSDINKWNSKASIKYWLWDPVKTYPNRRTDELIRAMQLGAECFSFDKDDCKKYGLTYNNNFYPYCDYIMPPRMDDIKLSKVMFFGANKGRLDEIVKVKNVLQKNKISYNFTVLSKNKKYIENYQDIDFLQRPVKYDVILDKINYSECILDIVQRGQSGLTWRPFEALFFDKKLITNNENIKEFDFYNKNNILILKDNNYNEIEGFLRLPFIKIDDNVKDKYRLKAWINNFFKE